jgi:hypothetical protein
MAMISLYIKKIFSIMEANCAVYELRTQCLCAVFSTFACLNTECLCAVFSTFGCLNTVSVCSVQHFWLSEH